MSDLIDHYRKSGFIPNIKHEEEPISVYCNDCQWAGMEDDLVDASCPDCGSSEVIMGDAER